MHWTYDGGGASKHGLLMAAPLGGGSAGASAVHGKLPLVSNISSHEKGNYRERMYSREEEFWAQRLAALQNKQRPAATSYGPAPPAYIPAYIPPSPASPRHPPGVSQAGSRSPDHCASTALVPAAAPALQASADALVQAAQVEALKLQVAQLRRANSELRQQLSSLAAERAAAAKREAIQQLAALRLESGAVQGVPACNAAAAGLNDATAAALQQDLGVTLAPGTDMVPLLYLQQLHTTYRRCLAELQQQHADALQQRAEEAEAQMRRQAEQYQREVRLLMEGLEDPAREAELQLLRDDCQYLKDKVKQLGMEYQRRVEVAAAEARLTAQRQAAAQQEAAQLAAAAEQERLQAQLAGAQAAAAKGATAAEDGAALERARHAAELARLHEQHAAAMEALKAECAASLQQREAQYAELLGELRSLRAAMSAAPSRADTRQEANHPQPHAALHAPAVASSSRGWHPAEAAAQHLAAWQDPAAGVGLASNGSQQQQQCVQQRSPVPAPGQLMEPLSDDEEQRRDRGGAWEQPRQTPHLLMHLKAAQAQR